MHHTAAELTVRQRHLFKMSLESFVDVSVKYKNVVNILSSLVFLIIKLDFDISALSCEPTQFESRINTLYYVRPSVFHLLQHHSLTH